VVATFAEIARTHRLQEEAFARHQEALLAGDLGAARRWLDRVAEHLRAHAALEERHLQPIYERGDAPRGGDPALFPGEHCKVERFLARLDAGLAAVAGPRDRIALFDVETHFKGLLEHHFGREEDLYFPQIQRLATEAERRAALDAFAAEEERLRAWLGAG